MASHAPGGSRTKLCQSNFCYSKAELAWPWLNWVKTGSWWRRTWGWHRDSAAVVGLEASRVIAKCLNLIWPCFYGVRTPIYYSQTYIWAELKGKAMERNYPVRCSGREQGQWKEATIVYGFLCFSPPYSSTGNWLFRFTKTRREIRSLIKSPTIVGLGTRQTLKLSI